MIIRNKEMKLVILSAALSCIYLADAFSTPCNTNALRLNHHKGGNIQMGMKMPKFSRGKNTKASALFPSRRSSFGDRGSNQQISNNRQRLIPTLNLMKKFRRTLSIFITSAFLLMGPIQMNDSKISFGNPPSAHASSITASSSSSRQKLDSIVDNYIQTHMFNDDLYDPIESTYRETIADSTGASTYPSQLSSTTSSVLGKKALQLQQANAAVEKGEGQAIKFVLRLVDTIHTKFGVPRPYIVPALFLVGFGIPTVLVLGLLMSFSINQKAMTERMAVERYGESVLDAEELKVEDDDDDDDYDYENDEYDVSTFQLNGYMFAVSLDFSILTVVKRCLLNFNYNTNRMMTTTMMMTMTTTTIMTRERRNECNKNQSMGLQSKQNLN